MFETGESFTLEVDVDTSSLSGSYAAEIAFVSNDPDEMSYAVPISMEIIGRYHDLGTFFDRVSKYSRIINVDSVRINAASNEENKSIRASFTATTFVYDDAGPEVAEEEL